MTANSPTFTTLFLILVINYVSCNIGSPPGVNPNIYNPNVQPHQPQMATQGFGQQQQQQQQQQLPPVQNVQYGAYQQAGHHQQQQPVGNGQAYQERKPVLHSTNIQHEKEHIMEHMDVPLDTSKMSEQELQFHYFKMHDADNNNKLDGCELIKSLIHWHEQGHENPQAQGGGPPPQPKLFGDEELMQLIDPILKMDDTNQDGYIDYAEFVRAQQKTATN